MRTDLIFAQIIKNIYIFLTPGRSVFLLKVFSRLIIFLLGNTYFSKKIFSLKPSRISLMGTVSNFKYSHTEKDTL